MLTSRNDFIIGTFEPYLQLVLIEIDITRRLKYYRAQTEEIVRNILNSIAEKYKHTLCDVIWLSFYNNNLRLYSLDATFLYSFVLINFESPTKDMTIVQLGCQ